MLKDLVKDKQGKLDKKKLLLVADQYIKEIEENGEKELSLKGKSLEAANMENSSMQHYYECVRVELNSVVKYVEFVIEKHRGAVFLYLTEKNQRDLSDRGKEKYIDSNDELLELNECLIAIKEVHNKYQSIVDAFKNRGFQLRNITELRIAQLNQDVM